jgi:High-affinity nickel-transport protein
VFGLDESIASFSDGTSVVLICAVAILLGLRHATDPDHLAAVTTLIAGGRARAARTAARLGLAWGLGHATTLFAFGIPIVVWSRYLPERGLQLAETAIAAVIVYLAVRLLVRWRRGYFHVHQHVHDRVRHTHLHAPDARHSHPARSRSPVTAYGIGLVHGMGGSAGVGILIVASVESTALALLSLFLLAAFTAVSMTLVTGGFGLTLDSRPVRRTFAAVAPVLGAMSLAFGLWYGSAAWSLAPYPF